MPCLVRQTVVPAVGSKDVPVLDLCTSEVIEISEKHMLFIESTKLTLSTIITVERLFVC